MIAQLKLGQQHKYRWVNTAIVLLQCVFIETSNSGRRSVKVLENYNLALIVRLHSNSVQCHLDYTTLHAN